jgi:ribonuclease VapC
LIVLDSSALIAILLRDPSADALLELIHLASRRLLSAGTLIEAGMVVVARLGDAGEKEFDALLARLAVEIVPVDAAQATVARDGFRRFGKGHNQAALNLGDLFAYALARTLAAPLLFVGNDFARTDVVQALPVSP